MCIWGQQKHVMPGNAERAERDGSGWDRLGQDSVTLTKTRQFSEQFRQSSDMMGQAQDRRNT